MLEHSEIDLVQLHPYWKSLVDNSIYKVSPCGGRIRKKDSTEWFEVVGEFIRVGVGLDGYVFQDPNWGLKIAHITGGHKNDWVCEPMEK